MEEAVLVDISNKTLKQDIALTSDKFCIGRGLQNSRVIEEINISRTHCILEHNNGEWCIWDKSSNGTWLNGHLLDKTRSHTLTNGDVIGLSETVKFVFKKLTDAESDNTNQKALSDNDILDIAETVIAEVEALDADFYMNKFDETVFGHENKNSESSNSSSNKNKQNVKSGLKRSHTSGQIIIRNLKFVQKPTVPENVQQPVIAACSVQESNEFEAHAAKPSSSVIIQPSSSVIVQPTENPEKLEISEKPSCSKDSSKVQAQKNLDFAEDELQCSICTEMFVKAVTLSCSHTFCKFCIGQWQKNQTVCPICRAQITMQFPTLVVDNFIEKILENASEDVKEHRRELIAERAAAAAPPPPPAASTSSSTNRRRRPAEDPIEISSSDDDHNSDDDEEDEDDYDDDDDRMNYSNSDWSDWDHDLDYNGIPGRYYGGYGSCYSCGDPGHWANGCPNRSLINSEPKMLPSGSTNSWTRRS